MRSPLFTGPASLRDPREHLAFGLTLLFALPAAAGLGIFLHESVGLSQVALFIVIAMVYVTLARGRLLGSSVRIHAAQYPRVFSIVKRACAALEIPMPLVFVRDDQFVPVAALGFGEPYSLVISCNWIEQFSDDELAFVIGRELGHIAAGHTRFLSLLSVNGKENPIIALIFGGWLRRCDLTCDKVGLLVCGSMDAAARAIIVSAFHHFGRQIDVSQFAQQEAEIRSDAVLRWGEWLGSEPYATKRIEQMRQFMATHAYQTQEEWFLREIAAEPPPLPAPGTTRVIRDDCPGWWRRFFAFAIDAILVGALIGSLHPLITFDTGTHSTDKGSIVSVSTTKSGEQNETIALPGGMKMTVPRDPQKKQEAINQIDGARRIAKAVTFASSSLWLALYFSLLVATAGQTFGMMIAGLRVVTVDYRRPGVARTLLRYIFLAISPLFAIVALYSPFSRRIMLHDRLSGTRLITSERVMARVAPTRA